MRITATAFNLQAVSDELPDVGQLRDWHQQNPSVPGAALVVPEADLPRGLGVDQELLLLVLPQDLEAELPALAEVRLVDYNRVSDDLLQFSTFIALQTEGTVVEFNVWETHFPRQARRFFIGLVAGESFVLSCHELDADEEEAFFGGLQGACAATGPNYRRFDYWSEEQIDAAAEGRLVRDTWGNEAPRRRVECRTVRRIQP